MCYSLSHICRDGSHQPAISQCWFVRLASRLQETTLTGGKEQGKDGISLVLSVLTKHS